MIKLKSKPQEVIENDLNLETIPRRQTERRKQPRRTHSKPQLLSQENISKLRQLDDCTPLIMRVGDRRQQERRKSRPTLLSVEDVDRMRKK